jgi:protein-disulfide isomerase
MEQNKFLVPIAIVIAGALITWGIMSSDGSTTDPTNTNTEQEISYRPITGEDHILGNPNADIVLIEYSDLECPYCKTFYFTTKALMEEYGKDGQLAIVFRNFPLDQLHTKARKEAIATECAAELGGNAVYWDYMDKLFEITPSNNGLDLAELPNIAKSLGLDVSAFNTCLNDPKIAEKIEADFQDGLKAGVLGTAADPGGTPYSLLVRSKDGEIKQVKGAQYYETVKGMIDELLTQ